jgi:hypothetical protein
VSNPNPPLQDQQGHAWKEPDKGQTRCVNCGAYRHLGSGIMACRNTTTDRGKMEALLRDTGRAINANNGRCQLIEDVLCRMTSVLVARINELDAAEQKAKQQVDTA